MNPRHLPALALAALLLVPALPAEAAFHGVAWSATGVATDGTHAYTIDVAWGGFYSFSSRNVFTVTLKDPATGAVVQRTDFLGNELLEGPPSYCCFELLFMSGTSLDPAVHFAITSTQFAFTSGQTMSQVAEGTFGAFSFAVSTTNQHYCFC